jgi:hypothetical protein
MAPRFIPGFLAILFCSCLGLPLAAQSAPVTPEKPAAEKKIDFYFWERIRQESWDNTASLNDNGVDSVSYMRLRTSLGAYWRPGRDWELHLRLTNENRLYLAPKIDPRLNTNFNVHEIFIDQLSVRWRHPAGLPLTVTAGRQDMMLGEGFLFMDGGPLDGSRSAYFNGLRLDYALKNKNTLTFFFVRQQRSDTLLPVINDQEQKLVEQEEQGVGFYFSGKAKRTGIEAYLFRKDTWVFAAQPGGALHVAGGRVVHPFSDRLSLTAEAALQLGTLGAERRRGLGGYFHLDRESGWRFPLPALLTLGGVYLSGDDPATPQCEGWDAAFSRWPKWSDSLIYMQVAGTRPADWTNFISLYGQLLFAPLEKVRLSLAWHRLAAAESRAPVYLHPGQSKDRGNLLISKLTFDVSRNFTGRLIWEYFHPGDFFIPYKGPVLDPYHWIQFELFFRF